MWAASPRRAVALTWEVGTSPRRRGGRGGASRESQQPGVGAEAGLPRPLAGAMEQNRAAARLRTLLGHLGRPSARAAVSSGLQELRPPGLFPFLRARVPVTVTALPGAGAEGASARLEPGRAGLGGCWGPLRHSGASPGLALPCCAGREAGGPY